jgi:hypothetical protein
MANRQIFQHEEDLLINDECKLLEDDTNNKTKMFKLVTLKNFIGEFIKEKIPSWEYGSLKTKGKNLIESANEIYDTTQKRMVSMEEIDLVTEEGFFVDALAVKELNRKLNVSASDIVSITPLAGQNYPNWGGCYYYKSGSRVHVHLGIQGLQANQVATVFVLPEAVHPKTRIFSVGPSGSFPGVSRTEIALDGGVNVTSNDTYAAADIEYDTY